MSKVHDGAERAPEEGGHHRTDAISDHTLGYRVRVTWAVERGEGREGRGLNGAPA